MTVMADGKKHKSGVSVAEFLDAGRERLCLKLETGKAGLSRRVAELAINRPGLALTGFFQYFAHRRIQILGHAEMAYLHSLSESVRLQRLRQLFARRVPCIVMTRRSRVFSELIDLGQEFHTPVLCTPLITKEFINAATLVLERLTLPQMNAQGTMVEILGVGVLIEGKVGVGKSETALALVKKGHSLIADDVTRLRLDSSGSLIGTAIGVTRFHMEIRGMGIIHVPSLFGVASVRGEKRLDMVVTLVRQDGSVNVNEDRSGQQVRKREYFGVSIPCVALPVAPGRDCPT
ncbi:MAG: HPr(Ser) kinase/phosphatase [bacterium]